MSLSHDDVPATVADCIRCFDELVCCLDRLAAQRPRASAYPIKVVALRALQARNMLEELERIGGVSLDSASGDDVGSALAPIPSIDEIDSAVREVAANLMRLARGTGRPEIAIAQFKSMAFLFTTYEQSVGEPYPAERVSRALSLDQCADSDAIGCREWDRATLVVIQGALQIAASELLEQHSMAVSGRKQLFAGNRELDRLHRRELGRMLRR